jgi:hypothetical protein
MPLEPGAINEIQMFAPEGTEVAGDLMPLADYEAHLHRLRGHQPGIASCALENRALRQVSLIAKGLAQYIANRFEPGVVDDGDVDAIEAGLAAAVLSQLPDFSGYLERDVADVLEAGFFTAPVAVAIAAGHVVLNPALGNVFTIAVDAAFTLDLVAGMAGKAGMMLLIATQDAVGGHALATAAGYHPAAGEWSTEADAVNLIWITSDGSGTALDVVIAQRGA